MRRLAPLTCLLVAACACAPPSAPAHGGSRLVTRTAGSYRVALDALAVRSGESVGVVDYTVYLERRGTALPVDDARVTVRVQTPGGVIGPLVARRRANTYETLIPVGAQEEWPQYRLSIRISSPGGGTVTIDYRPPEPVFSWLWKQPLVLAGALLALGFYVRGFRRLRRRGRRDLASAGRLCCFAGGIVVGVLALVSPIDPIGERYLLSVHMLQHVLIGDVAPALLVVGLRGPIGLFALPGALLRLLAASPRARRVGGVFLYLPVAVCVWAIAYGGWHIPAVYDAALGNQVVHDLEHASFFIAGLLVWTQLVSPLPRSRLTARGRMAVAILLFALGTVLANLLTLSLHPLYPVYAGQPVRLWNLDPLTDQRIAGAVMMVEQLASLTVCVAFLVRSDLRERLPARSRAELVT